MITMLIASLFILQAISAYFCFDIELEGAMRLGNSFMNRLSAHSANANKLRSDMTSIISKWKYPKKASNSAYMRTALKPNKTDDGITDPVLKYVKHSMTNQKTTSKHIASNKTKKQMNTDKHNGLNSAFVRAALKTNKTDGKKIDPLQKYVNHLKTKGKSTLKYISDIIVNDLNINKNITLILNTVTDDYVSMMQNYYNFVSEDKHQTFIDKEFAYLDMVETSCRMLHSEEKKLYDDIIRDKNPRPLNSSIQAMREKINKNSIMEKRNEMRHICLNYDVCRQYPAFSDYSADLITEVLKLPKTKFHQFIEILTKIFMKHDLFFEKMSEKEDRDLMASNIEAFANDLSSMKEFFVVLRAVITQRFKAAQNGNEDLKMRTKAMKILLDIIDKAISVEEDILQIDFDTVVSALKGWSVGIRGNIQDIFEEFVKHLLRILEYNLTNTAKQEIIVLIEIIMRSTTRNEAIYQRLFKLGSNFVKSNDLLTDLEIF